MKVLAINLPAFHRIQENDKWWGEGFTEWDNVKSGKPLYYNHYQPIKPLNNNYYDLSHKEDIEYQMKLADKYGLYGFIYYHYWFGNGKMLFEKPAEIIRDRIKYQFHYCFCWANESWITTWHGLKPKTLLEQKYPGINDWEKHYNYLEPFFYDNRYIKIENQPVLFIYNASAIPNYDEMIKYFNKRCKEKGFKGIYIVEYISSKNQKLQSNKTKAVMEFEPLYTTFFDISKLNLIKRFICRKINKTDYQFYDKLWSYIIHRTRTYNKKTIIKSCFIGWDNSARKGKNSMIVKGKTPRAFASNLQKLIQIKRKDASNEYLVINAWNEWSEGAYLEPDTLDQYRYLQIIRKLSH